MTVVDINIRHPPCKECHGSGLMRPTGLLCPKCFGRSAVVEYWMIFWSGNSGRAKWFEWPGRESRMMGDRTVRR